MAARGFENGTVIRKIDSFFGEFRLLTEYEEMFSFYDCNFYGCIQICHFAFISNELYTHHIIFTI